MLKSTCHSKIKIKTKCRDAREMIKEEAKNERKKKCKKNKTIMNKRRSNERMTK